MIMPNTGFRLSLAVNVDFDTQRRRYLVFLAAHAAAAPAYTRMTHVAFSPVSTGHQMVFQQERPLGAECSLSDHFSVTTWTSRCVSLRQLSKYLQEAARVHAHGVDAVLCCVRFVAGL